MPVSSLDPQFFVQSILGNWGGGDDGSGPLDGLALARTVDMAFATCVKLVYLLFNISSVAMLFINKGSSKLFEGFIETEKAPCTTIDSIIRPYQYGQGTHSIGYRITFDC